MLTCRDVIEFLMDYVDDAVMPRERALFEEHLAVCPQCVAFLRNYRRVTKLTKDALANGEPPSIAPLSAPLPIPEELVHAILIARRTEA